MATPPSSNGADHYPTVASASAGAGLTTASANAATTPATARTTRRLWTARMGPPPTNRAPASTCTGCRRARTHRYRRNGRSLAGAHLRLVPKEERPALRMVDDSDGRVGCLQPAGVFVMCITFRLPDLHHPPSQSLPTCTAEQALEGGPTACRTAQGYRPAATGPPGDLLESVTSLLDSAPMARGPSRCPMRVPVRWSTGPRCAGRGQDHAAPQAAASSIAAGPRAQR